MQHKKQFENLGNKLLVRAPAKVNLCLLVAGKRPDGFHELETIMAKINLYDELMFEEGHRGIELRCEGQYAAPPGPDNLVYRACERLAQKTVWNHGVRVTLKKNIPIGSGLGGGSSDAAAALLGLNRFANLGRSREELFELACELGSDVPFFLFGPAALCRGRGEKIDKIFTNLTFSMILALPDVSVATKRVYENYIHDAPRFETLHNILISHIEQKNLDFLGSVCANMLERSCFELHADLADLKAQLEALQIGPVCLSGSGAAIVCLAGGSDAEVQQHFATVEQTVDCECIIANSNRW